jgi:hypothetical protein
MRSDADRDGVAAAPVGMLSIHILCQDQHRNLCGYTHTERVRVPLGDYKTVHGAERNFTPCKTFCGVSNASSTQSYSVLPFELNTLQLIPDKQPYLCKACVAKLPIYQLRDEFI